MFHCNDPKSNEELAASVLNRRSYLGIERFDDRVVEALRLTDRGLFAPPGTKGIYADEPFIIGQEQMCSQPSMVAAMAMLLRLEPGMRVLEVGTGSGYSAVVAARLTAPGGVLHTIEFIEELSLKAQQTIGTHFPDLPIRFIVGDGSVGLPQEAPFHRIYLTAGAGREFDESVLLDQLHPDGILIYPESYGSLFLVEKTPKGTARKEFPGVGFVTLRGKNSGYR